MKCELCGRHELPCADCDSAREYLKRRGAPMPGDHDQSRIVFCTMRDKLERESGMEIPMKLVAVIALEEMENIGKVMALMGLGLERGTSQVMQ